MSHGLTAVSEWLSNRTVEEFGIARKPDVIHNFVDISRFNPEGRAALPTVGDPVEIVHVSNFRPVKRITDVIRVFHQISDRIEARLTFMGEGPDEGLARELVAELGLCDRVVFAGATPQVEEVLRRSHLLLLLSDYESFGLVSLEAMACGTPVVASDSGGIPEVVETGVTGLLFPVGRPELTAAGCLDLLADRDRWQRMSSNASRRARECFSSDLIVGEYERYYRALLDGEVWQPPADCRTRGASPE
jgi:N-acetyl-alpha-D-glucosaminyl L-malate synthase BshA